MVRGQRIERRFPPSTGLRALKDWREQERVRLRVLQAVPDSGTLQADINRYLETARAMPSYHQRAYDLRTWVDALGTHVRRADLQPHQLQTVMTQWLRDGLSPVTVRHRRTALRRLFYVLDGRSARNPVRDTTAPQEPPPEVRALSPALVAAILEQITNPKDRARLAVMAYCGLPQKQIGQLTPADVDFTAGTVRVQSRRKGKGASGGTRPLTEQALAAFRLMTVHEAWGPINTSNLWRSFQAAVDVINEQRLQEGQPALPKLRPYDLRHSFGTWIYEQTGDLETAARLLGHATLITARRYTLGAATILDTQAVAKLSAALGKVP